MGTAWNNWFHVTAHSYGSWLPGDPRGHRSRHHRDHVEGDYKNLPEDAPERRDQHRHARSLLKRPPVSLTQEQREIVARVFQQSLDRHEVLVAIVCIDNHHAHVLAKFPHQKPTDSDPWASRDDLKNPAIARIRHLVGIAKKDAARVLSDAGLSDQGGIWAKRARCQPINDRAHQVATYRYLQRHPRSHVLIPERTGQS